MRIGPILEVRSSFQGPQTSSYERLRTSLTISSGEALTKNRSSKMGVASGAFMSMFRG